ncbi:hypothetical protein QMO14_17520 [Variovorax sp. CAN2819]|nr:hypothetical protein [Variovorax sp. CAN15]MDN6885397.1 hypothetical protein [Variovorax sp. CAN15]
MTRPALPWRRRLSLPAAAAFQQRAASSLQRVGALVRGRRIAAG